MHLLMQRCVRRCATGAMRGTMPVAQRKALTDAEATSCLVGKAIVRPVVTILGGACPATQRVSTWIRVLAAKQPAVAASCPGTIVLMLPYPLMSPPGRRMLCSSSEPLPSKPSWKLVVAATGNIVAIGRSGLKSLEVGSHVQAFSKPTSQTALALSQVCFRIP